MTARRPTLACLVMTAIVLLSCAAEAAPRRSRGRAVRRPRPAATALTPVKSDELVQAALDRTPAGGIAELPQGTFRTAVVIDRPMTVRGDARGTTLDGAGLGVPVVSVLPGVAGVTIEGVRVQNGTSDGILADARADRLSLYRVVVTGCGGDGVRLLDVAGARIDLCVLDGNGGDGLDADGLDLGASRVTARGNAGAGLVARGAGAHVSDLVVVGGPTGILLAGGAALVERCRFLDAATAVRLADGSSGDRLATCDVQGGETAVETAAGSTGATISGVVAQGLSGDGMRLGGASHRVVDCTLADLGGSGVVVSGAGSRVEGCDVRRVLGEGLRLEGDGHVAADNLVESAETEGIHVAWGVGDVVTGNVIRQCGGRGFADDGVGTQASRNRID